jgi:hypothetical protein
VAYGAMALLPYGQFRVVKPVLGGSLNLLITSTSKEVFEKPE